MLSHSRARLFAVAAVSLLLVASCSDDSEPPGDTGGPVEIPVRYNAPGQVDMLFVIDDSGSMCHEQPAVADNLDQIMHEWLGEGVDLHVGVTTTSPGPNGELGELNIRPNPVPDGSEGCEITSRLVETQLERAADCTTSPDDHDTTLSQAQATCIDEPANCEIPDFDLAALFPPDDAYRPLPPVLKSSQYDNGEGAVWKDEFRRDFACMSMVGTRGSSFEKGFGALLAATSPEKVGAAWDPAAGEPANAPNYGLIRDSALSAAFIITDENDCTYDNERPGVTRTIDEQSACGDAVCTYANSSAIAAEESPLLPPEQVKQGWLANLTQLQGSEVTENDIRLMSAHGIPVRYDGEWLQDAQCGDGSAPAVETTCASSLGSAYSGDRYQRFVESFPAGRSRPQIDNPSAEGKICGGDFAELVGSEGATLPEERFCLIENPIACTSASDCATPLSGAAEPTCAPVPGADQTTCTSSLEVKLTAPESSSADDAMADLINSGLCNAQTVGTTDGRATCFMGREFYSVVACPELSGGITVEFVDDDIEARLDPLEVSVVLPEGTEIPDGMAGSLL